MSWKRRSAVALAAVAVASVAVAAVVVAQREARDSLEQGFRERTEAVSAALPTTDSSRTALGLVRAASEIAGSSAYLIDASGKVIGTDTDHPLGSELRDQRLFGSLRRADAGAYDNGRLRFASSPVPGTGRRLVVVVPAGELFAPVRSTAVTLWVLLAAFVAAAFTAAALFLRRRPRLVLEPLAVSRRPAARRARPSARTRR
jgi:hypothetical protein